MGKRWNAKKPVATVAALTLALSPLLTPAAALAADELTAGTPSANVPEWAVDDGAHQASTEAVELPARFDMRDKGWVTPAKLQSPWGTCWAFGAIAAAESSILSSAGNTYDKSGLDLSEKHLAWFAMRPVTEADDPAQAGEGAYPFRGGNQSYRTGGTNIRVTTLFAQGVGPVTEAEFPYRGVGADGKSHTTKPSLPLEEFEKDPEQGALVVIAEVNDSTPEKEKSFLEDSAKKNHTSYQQELDEAISYARGLYANVEYSKDDDWSIPTIGEDGTPNRFKHAGLIIKDGNVLPEYWTADRAAINDASMNAMKRELANGRGIVINYRADQALPGAASDSTYINKETWAQYTFSNVQPNHAVCIVGWDDSYSKENFAHYVFARDPKTGEILYDEDGNAQVYENSLEVTTPPADGAWIVKNSWGSQTDVTTDDLGNSIGYGEYGVRDAEGKATGYFYLSYYDQTIQTPETLSFSNSLLGPTGLVGVFQHDYMPAEGGFFALPASDDVMSSANVFDLKEGDGDQTVLSVGVRTSGQGQRATFAIYQLDDGATDPTDGKLLRRASGGFEYAGYHRLDLDEPLRLQAGHKYSIVSTVSARDAAGGTSYSVSANQGVSKLIREYLYSQMSEADQKKVNPSYNVAVVNKGESFLYKDGAWVDWSDYINAIPAPASDPGEPEVEKYVEAYPIDNFSIKMYTEPAGQEPDGWRRAEDKTWYYLRDGAKVTGWMQDTDGQWYHFANDGVMDTGWLKDADGQWYYLSQDHDGGFGHLVSGWVFDHGFWYYLAERHDGTFGRMLTGWQQVSGSWYYLYPQVGAPKGSCALDTLIDGYRVDASGRWVR